MSFAHRADNEKDTAAGATECYGDGVRSISQRELRNDNATVMNAVEQGESYTVTRRGVPVARLVPVSGDEAGMRCVRPARARFTPGALRRVDASLPTAEVIEDLRGDR